ncbi:MAG: SDR family NAD(P)-dependent oxidoreductase [Pseudomonadota bacterium]|nr:SDR family NAD(P)-dependent oxidoreductase [Pseudomonadota bacterium]
MRFTGKIAVVTGGSQGIGARIAQRLAAEGAAVAVIASSDRAKAEAVAARIVADGGRAAGHAADVRNAGQIGAIIDHVVEAEGRIDLLVNCAGVFFPTPIGATAAHDIDRMVDINLKGTFNTINAAAPHMKAAGRGKVVNLASVAAMVGVGGYSMYCATKAAVSMLTRALAIELAPSGINVNAVAPGNTATPMNENLRSDPALKPFVDAMAARTPSGRVFSDPDDIASLVLYLLSDDARAMHGSTVLIDEGFAAGM